MEDPMKRPLQFPKWHVPYLEKHRIYDLFHEMTRELVINQPDDHVFFLKQILQNAADSRDATRVIIISTPKVNSIELAKVVAGKSGHVIVTQKDIANVAGTSFQKLSSKFLVACLARLVRSKNSYRSGWILVDCIRDEEDACTLLKSGILPTHVIHPIAPFHPKIDDILYCNVKPNWPEYRRNIVGIRNAFGNVLREVHLEQKSLMKTAEEIEGLLKARKPLKPSLPRVIILGPRGSGRKTQAKLLAQQLGIVHVDFEYLICQAWNNQDKLGHKLRECRNHACFRSDLLSQVVNRKILDTDCLRNGWVLTGFPYTVTDLKYLDAFDTPPNRIIFLECDLNVCKERVASRLTDVHTGSTVDVRKGTQTQELEGKVLRSHPKDQPKVIEAELNYYCENYGPIRKYCGETADFVNGDQGERAVNEMILAIVVRGPPMAAPRAGFKDMEGSSSSDSCGCVTPPSLSKADFCFIQKV